MTIPRSIPASSGGPLRLLGNDVQLFFGTDQNFTLEYISASDHLSFKKNGTEFFRHQPASGGGAVITGTYIRFAGSGFLGMNDGMEIFCGSGDDSGMGFETTNTVDSLVLFVDTTGQTMIFTSKTYINSNFALSAQSQPTMVFHDGTATLGNVTLVREIGADLDIAPQASGGMLVIGGGAVLPSYTVAGLPTPRAGATAYVSNGRKTGEGAGSGTGLMVYSDGTNWLRPADDSAVAA